MRGIKFWVLLVIVSLTISLNATAQTSTPQAEEIEKTTQTLASNESDTQWLWGEVKSLDIPNNELTINYFDYETDSEKEMKINVNDKTKYENVNSLTDIKLNDTISVDYTLSPDGKYIAQNISVEKPEETSPPPASTTPSATP